MTRQIQQFDIIIVGGGLAGLTSAIHLSHFKNSVLLIEKNEYPKHKVCGEYISNEVLPYLNSLGIDPIRLGAKEIEEIEISTVKSNQIKSKLPLGGFGTSRYFLDNVLFKKAKEKGTNTVKEDVINVSFQNDIFTVETKENKEYQSKIVIGAFGKRSSLDIKMNRKFIRKKSPYLAVKIHVEGKFQENLVGLHNFKGGYCGVSKVENDAINLCYITNFKAFQHYKNIEEFQEQVVFKNTHLKEIFKNTTPLFEKPLTISQISFKTKKPVENHVIMCGDTAGMIHPLCGNGMGMAIRSAQIASEKIIQYLDGTIKSRELLEKSYIRDWNKEFKMRLRTGHLVARLFRQQRLSEITLSLLRMFPRLLPYIIKRTHGKPLKGI